MKKLTKKETSLLVEALLFASSTDICANWGESDYKEFLKLAKKINKISKTSLDNIELYGKKSSYDNKKISMKIRKNFKIKSTK